MSKDIYQYKAVDKMKKINPLINANNGKPVALCNRCFAMMCYVSCVDHDYDKKGNCVVIEVRSNGKEDYIKTPIGKIPPAYCDNCNRLLTYSVNE